MAVIPMDRRDAVRQLLAQRQNLAVITGLGSSAYDVYAAGDHEHNVYLWGAMGSAAMIGLGLAKAQPDRPVLVLTGDGEMLMGMGALATIGIAKPKNLTIGVLDNGHYGETGMQLSHTGHGVELTNIASACGFKLCKTVKDSEGIETLKLQLYAHEGPVFASIKIANTETRRVLPPRDGVYIKNRFRAASGFGTL